MLSKKKHAYINLQNAFKAIRKEQKIRQKECLELPRLDRRDRIL